MKWFFHPISIFVLSTIALAISLALYIYWYVGVTSGLRAVVLKYHLDPTQFFEAKTWVVILVLSILVGLILAGILIIFIYNLKLLQLYHLQHNFINNFTHELKTPVTSLKLYLETFAAHGMPREDQLVYVGFMLQDVERLSANITSILNLARIESKAYERGFTSTDLVALVRGFLASNRHIFHQCEINVDAPSGEYFIHPVIVPFFEIFLMNILINAIKYNASRTPRVDISFRREERNLSIRFSDNGIGIVKGEEKKIFRKFYQTQGQTERRMAGGSGLGLYLAKQIAKIHRGVLTAESGGAGKGAAFILTLPVKK
ncbi:MAG: HAMP domain-containing sensor histidine kinase [Smithellaceae bacterium]|nr:HAMP domain-containing sensor histidine kinase [Smithellaceae bacterium]